MFPVPEVLGVHEVPSPEVRMVPYNPTVANLPLPRATPTRVFVVPEVLELHVVPSGEVRMVPEFPTTTKVLFP